MGDRFGFSFDWESSIIKGKMHEGVGWVEADDEREARKEAERKLKRFQGGRKKKYELKDVWRV